MTSKKIFSLARELCLKYANSKHTMLPPPGDDYDMNPDTVRSERLSMPSSEEAVDMGWDDLELAPDTEVETQFPDALTEFPEGPSKWKVDHSIEGFPDTERETLSPEDDVYLSEPKTMFPESKVTMAARKLCKKYAKLGR